VCGMRAISLLRKFRPLCLGFNKNLIYDRVKSREWREEIFCSEKPQNKHVKLVNDAR
jgi:hypothetical protein